MDRNDPELSLCLALENIERAKRDLDTLELQVKDGLRALQERKPKRKRSKKE